MNHDTFNIGVFAIIFDRKKRILFCHRTDCDLWNLPGGALEKGEAPELTFPPARKVNF